MTSISNLLGFGMTSHHVLLGNSQSEIRDTVDSVGIIPKRLPFTTSNTIVRTFRHAVALDERRSKFKANLWNRPDADELKLGKDAVLNASNTAPGAQCAVVEDDLKVHHHHPSKTHGKNGHGSGQDDHQHQRKTRKESDNDRKLNTMERMYSTASQQTTDIEEVWFAVSTFNLKTSSAFFLLLRSQYLFRVAIVVNLNFHVHP